MGAACDPLTLKDLLLSEFVPLNLINKAPLLQRVREQYHIEMARVAGI